MQRLESILGQRRGLASRILIAQVLFLALLWFGHVDFKGQYAQSDLAQYRLMAQSAPSLRSDIPAPFAFRLAVPFLAGLISPFDDVFGFDLLHLVFLCALVLQFHRVLRLCGASEAYAFIAASLFAWNPYGGGFLCFNAFQAGDALAYFLLLASFEAMVRRRLFLFAATLAVGSLVRETPLLIIPAILLSPVVTISERKAFAAASLPAITAFIALRFVVPVSNPEWSIASTLWSYAPEVFSVQRLARMSVSAFAPISLLIVALTVRNGIRLSTTSPAHILVVLIILASFVGGDVERLMSPALLFLLIIHREQLTLLLESNTFRIILAISVAVCSNHFLFHAHPVLSREWYYAASFVTSVIIAGVGYMLMMRWEGESKMVRHQES